MQQRIIGFHQDDEQHWVADLECGHAQHVRHDPPWLERRWVLTEASRQSRIGTTLNCVLCDDSEPLADGSRPATRVPSADEAPAYLSSAAREAYLDARLQGLCHEGALEIASDIQKRGRT